MGSARWSVTGWLQGILKKAEAGLATRANVATTQEVKERIVMDKRDSSNRTIDKE
jgi:hypothetical protein